LPDYTPSEAVAFLKSATQERLAKFELDIAELRAKELSKTCKAISCTPEPLVKPPVSEAQRAAMGAAASGNSTLGIPKDVGQDYIESDKGGKLPAKKSELAPKPKQSRERRTGRYDYEDFSHVCANCGSTLATHDAEAPHANDDECRGPTCEGFKRAKVKKSEPRPEETSESDPDYWTPVGDIPPKKLAAAFREVMPPSKVAVSVEGKQVHLEPANTKTKKSEPPTAKPPSGKLPTPTGNTVPTSKAEDMTKTDPGTAQHQARQHLLADSSRQALAPAAKEPQAKLPSAQENEARANMYQDAMAQVKAPAPAPSLSPVMKRRAAPKPMSTVSAGPVLNAARPAPAKPGIFGRLQHLMGS